MRVSVRADLRAVTRDLDRVQRTKVPKAAAQALNRTNKRIVSPIVRALSRELNIKPARRIRRRVLIPRGAPFHASPSRLRAGGLVLTAFVPEIWTIGRGARARASAQGPNRFVATMSSGHTGLFRRRGKARLPIVEFLVDLSHRAARITDDVLEAEGARRFVAEFERTLARALRVR